MTIHVGHDQGENGSLWCILQFLISFDLWLVNIMYFSIVRIEIKITIEINT